MTITPKPDSVVYRVRVAVPVHLYDTFDYTLTEAQYERAHVGSRVAISFGRQNLIGIITEKVNPHEPFTGKFQLKAISELLDDEPILDEQVLSLLTWSAQYYQFPVGEVMQTALPAILRQGKPMDVILHHAPVPVLMPAPHSSSIVEVAVVISVDLANACSPCPL